MKTTVKIALPALLAAMLMADPALAQDAIPGVSPETGFILTTFMFLVTGFLVMCEEMVFHTLCCVCGKAKSPEGWTDLEHVLCWRGDRAEQVHAYRSLNSLKASQAFGA